jgi:predicted transcriptional regulator
LGEDEIAISGGNAVNDQPQPSLTELTVDLLAAFVSNNTVGSSDLPKLIASTHAALAALKTGGEAEPPEAEAVAEPEYRPAVSIRKSLGKREHILSMIDGKPYKTLKRHLSGHGLTPAQYRERYKLPADYPMVAPAYSEARREVAKRLGLGRKPGAKRGGRARAD